MLAVDVLDADRPGCRRAEKPSGFVSTFAMGPAYPRAGMPSTAPSAAEDLVASVSMSEGTIGDDEAVQVTPERVRRRGSWLTRDGTPYQRPKPPDGYRESHRYCTVPEADVLKRGRAARTFGYNVNTVARLAGKSTSRVRKAMKAGEFALHDLASVLGWITRNLPMCASAMAGDPAVAPALPEFYSHFTMLWGGPRKPSGPHQIRLAVPMPVGQAREDMTRMFWRYRTDLQGFRGTARELARRIYELDGIARDDVPASKISYGGQTLYALVECGVLTLDREAMRWDLAPFPTDIEDVLRGLMREGFIHATIVESHIVIGRDWCSLGDSKRLLAYMRTSRLTASACGRGWRIWIVGALYRAMHGYKERRIFRRSRFGVPTERAAVIE